MTTPSLSRITIYPIKSLDGVELHEANILANGALENDRRFALIGPDGCFVNGKRTVAVHRIRAEYDLAQLTVRLNSEAEFSLLHQRPELGAWLSDALGIECLVAENRAGGFPDDTDTPGPTLISTATLQAVNEWFPALALDEIRHRFRANLEIEGVEAFWEDRLVGPTGTCVRFQIGNTYWLGANPCQRCVVPTRGSKNGEPISGFQKHFAEQRAQSLPAWAPADRFNHFYRLAVNTKLAEGSQAECIRIADSLHIIG